MTAGIVSVVCGGPGLKLPLPAVNVILYDNSNNILTPCEAYQETLERSHHDWVVWIHDDVTVHDCQWQYRIHDMCENPNCVVVGFGGAISLGHPDLYKKPYKIDRMARSGYCSNQTDAEVHGERFTGDKRVATLDAFLMAVRREWLVSIGGWPVKHLSFHCMDLWLACEAARAGKEVWMAGVSCTHHGGGTSTKGAYAEAKWLQGGNRDSDHAIPHRWLYDTYADVLPISI